MDVASDNPTGVTGPMEIYGTAPTPGFDGVSLSAAALDALNAGNLIIGAGVQVSGLGGPTTIDPRTQSSAYGNRPQVTLYTSDDTGIVLRSGAILRAPQVMLVSGGAGVTLESGAAIDTIGQTVAAPPPPAGGYGSGDNSAILAVSNQDLISLTGGTAPITLERWIEPILVGIDLPGDQRAGQHRRWGEAGDQGCWGCRPPPSISAMPACWPGLWSRRAST